jgi:hypothetical protein
LLGLIPDADDYDTDILINKICIKSNAVTYFSDRLCETYRQRIAYTELFKKKYPLSNIFFAKNTDAKSMPCARMERKSLRVQI